MWAAGAPEASAELDSDLAVAAVAHALEKLVARNDQIVGEWPLPPPPPPPPQACENMGERERGLAAFRGSRRPAMSIRKYLERIQRYGRCSSACIVAGFVYLDRVVHRRPESLVGSLNVHRLMLAGVMIASKFFEVT
ncbi:Cyclin-U1-1 [Apostasia shenzhenica]|uniref:Cyclin-U1-1 n=1 Tax=Apostasia shenzhenica TaxID=1088818 RepID=A0A2I0ADB5_9ASPA|nr:Cyclin-U1-1 [Apostasia shenzhenica]